MKFFLVFCLFSLSAQAALKFAMERSTHQGQDKFEVTQENGFWTLNKNSNWFDKESDTRLGIFRIQNASDIEFISNEIAKIENDLKSADARLSDVGKNFNGLNTKSDIHSPYFRVGNYIVQKHSLLYGQLEKIVSKLQKTSLELVDGVELTRDRQTYVFYKKGTEIKREHFDVRFFCESPRFPTHCLAREWGAFYLD